MRCVSNDYHILLIDQYIILLMAQIIKNILCQTIDIFHECVIIVSELVIKRLHREEQIWTIERWLNE